MTANPLLSMVMLEDPEDIVRRLAKKQALAARVEEFYNKCNSAEDGRFCEGPDGPGRERDPDTEDLGKKGYVSKSKKKPAEKDSKPNPVSVDKTPSSGISKTKQKKLDSLISISKGMVDEGESSPEDSADLLEGWAEDYEKDGDSAAASYLRSAKDALSGANADRPEHNRVAGEQRSVGSVDTKRNTAENTKDLSTRELTALQEYHKGGFNRHLLSGKKPTEAMKDLDQAIGRSVASEAIKVHRGVDGNVLSKLESLEVGETYTDETYIAATTTKSVAQNYADRSLDNGLGDGAVITITIPKGGKVLAMGRENEVLISRGSSYRKTGPDTYELIP